MTKYNFLMFIDDDEATNYYHRFIVEESGLCDKYIFFDSAGKALDYFEAENEEVQQLPDIIFLDVNMPYIDGWGFLDRFQKINIEKPTVVVMLTTSLNPRDKAKADSYGLVEGVINKPLSKEHLEKWLSHISDKKSS